MLVVGIDVIMVDLCDSIEVKFSFIDIYIYVIVFFYENLCDICDESGVDWFKDVLYYCVVLCVNEIVSVIGNYFWIFGILVKFYFVIVLDVDFNMFVVVVGFGYVDGDGIVVFWIGCNFGFVVVICVFDLIIDVFIVFMEVQFYWFIQGSGWWFGKGYVKGVLSGDLYKKCNFVDGLYFFECLKCVNELIIYIDCVNVVCVFKCVDMFVCVQFGDMGKMLQDNVKGGYYVCKVVFLIV